MNLQSRTPKSKRKAQILTAIRNGKSEQIELLDEEYPSVLFLPIFNEAPILRELPYRGNPNDLLLDTYRYHFDMNARMIMGKLEADILLSPKLDLLVWRRIIAKIAHATAVAELGLDGFIPLLSDVLRDPNRDAHDIQDYVGGSSFAPSDQHGHSLNLSRIAANGTMFIVVDITLFSIFEAPTYRVAVGYVSGTPAPVLPRKRPAIFDFKRRS